MSSNSGELSHHHMRLSHPQHFDFDSVHEVPDSHAWHNLDDHPSADAEAVPVIDLTASDATELLGRACEDWGAFQLIGHGISTHLFERLDSQIRRLFSLSTDRKQAAARVPGALTGYGLAPISSFFSKFMWSEGFTVSGSVVDHARQLWPQPHDHTQFCDVMDEYRNGMKVLAGRLMQLMLRYLGLDVEAPTDDNYRELSAVLQLNWYPACPAPDQAMGMAPHTDSGLLTLLYQSSASGLQVLHREDLPGGAQLSRWVTVPPLPGALVVNVGDLAHILSNGRFHSVLHRAVVNRNSARLSAAYIFGPPADLRVYPLVGRPQYRAVTWPEYRGIKARLFDKSLASITLAEEDHSSPPSPSSSSSSSPSSSD